MTSEDPAVSAPQEYYPAWMVRGVPAWVAVRNPVLGAPGQNALAPARVPDGVAAPLV